MSEKINLDDRMFELLPEEEKNSEFIAMESKTFLKDAWGRYKKNKLAMIGLAFRTLKSVSPCHRGNTPLVLIN